MHIIPALFFLTSQNYGSITIGLTPLSYQRYQGAGDIVNSLEYIVLRK